MIENKQLQQIIVEQFGNADVKKLFSPFIDPPQCCLSYCWWNLTKRMSIDQILDNSQVLYHSFVCSAKLTFRVLVFSEFLNNQLYLDIFDELMQYENVFDGISTWNSHLSQQFFNRIGKKQNIKIRLLHIFNSFLGNTLANKLSVIDTSKLLFLRIWQDPINNEGFKMLMKIRLPYLGVLQIGNTNMTNDMKRLMIKKDVNACQHYSFFYQKYSDANQFIKSRFRCTDGKRNIFVCVKIDWSKCNVSPFIGFCAKAMVKMEQNQMVSIDALERSRFMKRNQIPYPSHLVNILQKGFNLVLQ